jgi:L-threonylcarbamoyladenylate synthase
MTAGPEEIAEAVERLRRGGLVAFPTETVYGLGADAFNAKAVARVYTQKGRPPANPLIVHVSGEEMARTVVAAWPPEATRLAEVFWPGPLTLVLRKSDQIPEMVTAGGATVGVRCPDHPITLALLEAFGGPLVGPSANPSGRVSPTRASHVREAFPEPEVFVLDGGPSRGGIESTVLLLEGEPRVLRPGLVSAEEIAGVLGRHVAGPRPEAGEGPAQSPGLQALHYAPRSRAVIVDGHLPPAPARSVLITHRTDRLDWPAVRIDMPGDAHGYASRLYEALRTADESGPELIAIDAPPRDGAVWEAIWDRLRRATAPRE